MRFVVDASVALKWVVPEAGSADADALRRADQLLAPDLIVTEWANALWKKVGRGEIALDDALLAARVLQQAQIELRPMRGLLRPATELALALNHPTYDCFYLALAAGESCPFVTADERVARKIAGAQLAGLPSVLTVAEAARLAASR